MVDKLREYYAAAADAARITLENGGGTFDAETLRPVHPTSGYAVGVGHLGAGNGAIATVDYIAERLLDAHTGRRSVPYIGTWAEHDIVYIDRVVILPDRESALTLARAFGEKAIWDFATGTEVYTRDAAA